MAHFIKDTCFNCGACAAKCPMKAISLKGNKYVVDENKCVDCSNCTKICPIQAAIKKE